MEAIRLKPTRGPELSFEGELIVRSEGGRDDPSTLGRFHDISIYRQAAADRWVVGIAYHSPISTEVPALDVEVVDNALDIELVLQMYQPNEYVDRASLRSLYEEARKRIVSQLFSSYDRQVRTILQTLTTLGVRPLETSPVPIRG